MRAVTDDSITGMMPPCEPEHEKTILGSLFLDSTKLSELAEMNFSEEHFYMESHREIYLAILRLSAGGKSFSCEMVVTELKTAGKLDEAGGIAYLTNLSLIVSHAGNIGYAAQAVKKAAKRRVQFYAARDLMTSSQDSSVDPEESRSRFENEIRKSDEWDTIPVIDDDLDSIKDPGIFPNHLLAVPGLVGEVIQYTHSISAYSNPVINLAGALALQATLCSRVVVSDDCDCPNIYVLGLADSGTGKDAIRKSIKHILSIGNLDHLVTGPLASGQGLEDRLYEEPVALCMWDEIHSLFESIRIKNGGENGGYLISRLMEFYTSSNSFVSLRVKTKKKEDKATPTKRIRLPHLSIFGTSVPANTFKAFSENLVTGGMIPRTLVFHGSSERVFNHSADPLKPVPFTITNQVEEWRQLELRTNPDKYNSFPDGEDTERCDNPNPIKVPFSSDARNLLEELRRSTDERINSLDPNESAIERTLLTRVYENVKKLALIYACSANVNHPEIDHNAVEWAAAVVRYQVKKVLWLASQHMSRSQYEEQCKQVFQSIEAGSRTDKGRVSHKRLKERTKDIDRKIFENIMADLTEQGVVVGPLNPEEGESYRGNYYETAERFSQRSKSEQLTARKIVVDRPK